MSDLPDFLQKHTQAPPPKELVAEWRAEKRTDALIDHDDARYLKMREIPHRLQRFLWALQKTGKMGAACEIAGLARSSVYYSRKKLPIFDELYGSIILFRQQVLLDKLEGAAVTRAVDGVEKGIWYKGDLVGTEKQYSDGLLTTLLKANDPDKYRERSQVDHSGDVGIGMNLLVVPAVQSVDDWSKSQGKGLLIEHKVDNDLA